MKTNLITTRLATAALGAVLLAGCEDREVTLTPTFDRTFDIDMVGAAGAISSHLLTAAEIRGGLDIPSNATVHSVHLESINVTAAPNQGNTANEATIRVEYFNSSSGTPAAVSQSNVVVPLAAVYTTPIDNLVGGVIQTIRNDVQAILLNQAGAPTAIGAQVRLISTAPGGATVNMAVHVTLKATVTYTVCKSVYIFGVGPSGPECDSGEDPF